MKELRGRVVAIVGAQADHRARVCLAAVRPVLVRVHGGLRLAGRAARPEPERRLVAVGRGRLDRRVLRLAQEAIEIAQRPPIRAQTRDEGQLDPGQGRLDALEHAARRHHQRGARLLAEVRVVGGPQQGVARHGDRADLHRRQIGGGQLGRVGQDQQHAPLRLDARAQERRRDAIDQRSHIAVAERLAFEPDGGPVAAAGAQVAVDEVGADVVPGGEVAHGERKSPSGARCNVDGPGPAFWSPRLKPLKPGAPQHTGRTACVHR